jgi:twitching motility protein PilT
MDLTQLLTSAISQKASDLHIASGLPPLIRVDGELLRLDLPALDHDQAFMLLNNAMNEQTKTLFAKQHDADFALDVPHLGRFRVNVFQKCDGIAGAFRAIPQRVPTLEELGMPSVLQKLAMLPNGLVLVTGSTGTGKSTTLASLIDFINERQQSHIITIEDPIEYLHTSKKCLVNQREVKRDTLNFNAALRAALRQDPDIILVGEMRDLETVRLALTAAETGHLVFATLHTASAARTINRIIDIFPGDEKSVVRSQLAQSLRAVVSQVLIKKIGGGRIAAHEIMIATGAVRNLIREGKTAQLYSTIQTGANIGMHTLDQNLKELVDGKLIALEIAEEIAEQKENM